VGTAAAACFLFLNGNDSVTLKATISVSDFKTASDTKFLHDTRNRVRERSAEDNNSRGWPARATR
jgi:hypothetical protein